MKTQEQIKERVKKLNSYLDVLGELGKLSNNEKYFMTKEIKVLEWVLGINEKEGFKKEVIYTAPVTDKIIEVLRENAKGLTANDINFKLGRSYSAIHMIRNLLIGLCSKGKVKKLHKEVSKYNPQIYVLNKEFKQEQEKNTS